MRLHVPFQGCSIFVTFYSLLLFFDGRPIWSFSSLSESRFDLFRPAPVSVGLLLVSPGLPRPPLEDIPKKEKVTKSYTFRSEDCNMEDLVDEPLLAQILGRGEK